MEKAIKTPRFIGFARQEISDEVCFLVGVSLYIKSGHQSRLSAFCFAGLKPPARPSG